MDIFYKNKNMDQIKEAAEKNTLVILPVGMLEEHGPHLPVSTDNIIAENIAIKLAEGIKNNIPVLVLPVIWTGYHGNLVAKMPGSIRVKPETLLNFVYDVLESLVVGGFKKIMIINGHGQNPAMLEIACRKIADDLGVNPILTYAISMIGKKGKQIRKSRQGGAGGHACEIETSLILALEKDMVDMSKAPDDSCEYRTKFVSGDMFPEQDCIKGVYWSTFAIQKTKSGILGDATAASGETGEKLLKEILKNYVELAYEYYFFMTGAI